MVNEVNLSKARQADSADYLQMAKMFLNAKRGRLGMRLTQHEREGDARQETGGRGWGTAERANEGW
jgi:hypothetical protein